MSNTYRVVLAAISQDQEVLNSFLGRLLMDGWYAHVPVDDTDGWCGYLYPEFRIMAGGRTFSSSDNQCLPTFRSADCKEQLQKMIEGEVYPGFDALLPNEKIVFIMGESEHAPPYYWAEAAIEKYYDAGLRFFMGCYDIGDVPYMQEPRRIVFYSAAAQHKQYKLSQHCVGIEIEGVPLTATAVQ